MSRLQGKASMSVEEYRALAGAHGLRPKYGNKQCIVDGRRFDSLLEGRRYQRLAWLRGQGFIKWFLCQVPFRLPGGITYRVDFLIRWSQEAILQGLSTEVLTLEDAKGMLTDKSRIKIRQVEEIYGETVTLINKRNVDS